MKVAVYCGSSIGNQDFLNLTKALARWIVSNNYDLVYGGGNVGLMEVIAQTVLDGNQKVYGVIPTFLIEQELVKENLTNLEVVLTMQERKLRMMNMADIYIALPGGPGTLEEISEVISLGRVREHQNPCILLNYQGYYEPLRSMYQKMLDNGFLDKEYFDKIYFVDSIDQLNDIIKHHSPY